MRESNFAFPAQNRACVCITSQLYDRRALDTSSPLPLLNSLTHLTYLTSTSPRIREILTCDGGLERLVRLLRDFCFSPPPPENPAFIFGLSPHGLPRSSPAPSLNPKNFDRHASYRFSLAFQCLVNIGVRGSEPIRARVVQAGALDVVGCVLEAWLAAKGFAVGPAVSASGAPRESREQRQQRRQMLVEQRQREQAQELARLLALASEDEQPATSDLETSAASTPLGSGTPTSVVVVPGRDRSGTVVGRRVRDEQERPSAGPVIVRSRTIRARPADSATPSSSTSRPDTETEDDGEPDNDIDMTMSQDQDTDENMPPPRRTVGIVADSPTPAAGADMSDTLDVDAHIIINTNAADDGVSDGIVALEQNVNDDLALGAPPGAPGAIDATPRTRTNTLTLNTRNMNINAHQHHNHAQGHPHAHGREEMTPRAVLAALPTHSHVPMPPTLTTTGDSGANVVRRIPSTLDTRALRASASTTTTTTAIATLTPTTTNAAGAGPVTTPRTIHRHHHHHHLHGTEELGPFREEDVLQSLQLLAYLSKYPHLRQAFYKPRLSFHPATAQGVQQSGNPNATSTFMTSSVGGGATEGVNRRAGTWARSNSALPPSFEPKKDLGFFKTLTGRGKEKAPAFLITPGVETNVASTASPSTNVASNLPRMTNVFSLVERFTFRPSPTESSLPTPPPFLPPEIQYWAGVIMRNACRKDESRGGIRQCANMLCGKWESFPREFAKCRRCRKAKYCGKECQSRAWSEGHRFWCSARDGDDAPENTTGTSLVSGLAPSQQDQTTIGDANGNASGPISVSTSTTGRLVSASTQERVERRQARERERQRLANAAAAAVAVIQPNANTNASTAATTTNATSIFLRSREANGESRVNPITAYFGTRNGPETRGAPIGLPNAAAASVAIPISGRRRSGVPPSVPDSSTLTSASSSPAIENPIPLPVNLNLDLHAYTAEEQTTIRNFLQVVGMVEQADRLVRAEMPTLQRASTDDTEDEAIADGTGPVAISDRTDGSSVRTQMQRERQDQGYEPAHERLRERMQDRAYEPDSARGGERLLPERIQALDVHDRRSRASTSRVTSSEEDDDDMILG